MKTVFLSIIIPVYNSESYLRNCLDSILNQANKDLEVICINDGSTDSSASILKEYSDKYNEVVVVNQENYGQGYARNIGIEKAIGKYYWFVDSDDSIVQGSIAKIISILNTVKTDTLVFTYNKVSQNELGEFEFDGEKGFEEGFVFGLKRGEEAFALFMKGKIQPLCCNKVYSRNLFENHQCRFTTGIYFEDFLHNTSAISQSESVYFKDEEYFNYFERDESTMTKKCKDKHVKSIFIALKGVEEVLHNTNKYSLHKEDFVKLFWFHLTFVFNEIIQYGSLNQIKLFMTLLKEKMAELDSGYFNPLQFEQLDEKILPFAPLMSLMMDNEQIQKNNLVTDVIISFSPLELV